MEKYNRNREKVCWHKKSTASIFEYISFPRLFPTKVVAFIIWHGQKMKVNIVSSSCPHNPYTCPVPFRFHALITRKIIKKTSQGISSKINRQKTPGDDSQTVLDDYCHNSECDGAQAGGCRFLRDFFFFSFSFFWFALQKMGRKICQRYGGQDGPLAK